MCHGSPLCLRQRPGRSHNREKAGTVPGLCKTMQCAHASRCATRRLLRVGWQRQGLAVPGTLLTEEINALGRDIC
jgi:hypothetical protein